MSIIYGIVLGIFFAFFPVVMALYYKSKTSIIIINLILCLFGLMFGFIPNLVAFIISAVSIGIKNTVKSILFCLLLIVIGMLFFAADLTVLAGLIGAI